MRHTDARRRTTRGFGLVELLVGVAVGLALMAGAFAMAGLQLGEHHRLMLELQIQQELRAVAELMLRDLRRAAFWENAHDGVWSAVRSTPARNPHAALSIGDAEHRLVYSYSRDGTGPGAGPGGGTRDTSGFRLVDGRIDQLIAGRYQPVTDPAVLRVLSFETSVTRDAMPVDDVCDARPHAGREARMDTRLVLLSIEAQATHDPRVRHRLDVQGRLRNDTFTGGCA